MFAPIDLTDSVALLAQTRACLLAALPTCGEGSLAALALNAGGVPEMGSSAINLAEGLGATVAAATSSAAVLIANLGSATAIALSIASEPVGIAASTRICIDSCRKVNTGLQCIDCDRRKSASE